MRERSLQLPSRSVLFLLFFSYATAAALIFQNLLLPLVDSAHYGQGLIQGDSAYFHGVAVKLAASIREEGWAVWRMYPAQGATGNVALLAALYVLFGDTPSLMVPVNAAVHALTGVLLYTLGCTLWAGRVGKVAGMLAATLFVIFPSALNWYAQIHKDGFAIVGSVLILLAWLRLDSQTLEGKSLFGIAGLTLAGISLIMFVRPYSLKIVILGAIAMLGVALLAQLRKLDRSAIKVLVLKALIIVAMATGVAITPKMSYDGDKLYVEWDSKSVLDEERRARLGKYADMILSWEWKPSAWVPAMVEGYAEATGRTRVGLITLGLIDGAGSIYDIDSAPDSTPKLLAYLPRGLQIALFAPFPSSWFEKLSVTRLVAVAEMLIWYSVAPGVLLAFWYGRRSMALWSILAFSLAVMMVYGATLANVGTLYRMRYLQLFLLMLIGLIGWMRFFELRGWLRRRNAGKESAASAPFSPESRTQLQQARSGLLSSGMTVAAIVAVSFFGLFLRDILMARMFGLGDELDAFVAATLVPMFLVAVLSVPIGTAIVPVFLGAVENQSPESAHALARRVAILFIFPALTLAVAMACFGPAVLEIIGWSVLPDKVALVHEITFWTLAIFVCSGLVTLANGILNALGRYALPAAAQAVVPVVAILTLLLGGNIYGVVTVAIAMFAGQLLNLVLVLRALAKEGVRLFGQAPATVREAGGFVSQYLPLVAAAAFMQIGPPVGTAMASTLPSGSVAALGLGSKAVLFITGLAGAAITSAVLPYFSRHLAQSRLLDARRELSFLLLAGTVISIPVAVVLHQASTTFVRLAFEGGAFGAADTELVSGVMAYGVLQLPFFITNILLLKFAIASRRSGRVMIASLIGLCVSIAFSLALMGKMGVPGIALAMTLAAAGSASLMLLLFCRLGDVAWVDLVFVCANWGLFMTAMVCLHYHSYAGAAAAIFAYVILMLGEWRSIRESVPR